MYKRQVDGVAMADLCYEEDSAAEVDMNIIMTDEGSFEMCIRDRDYTKDDDYRRITIRQEG